MIIRSVKSQKRVSEGEGKKKVPSIKCGFLLQGPRAISRYAQYTALQKVQSVNGGGGTMECRPGRSTEGDPRAGLADAEPWI